MRLQWADEIGRTARIDGSNQMGTQLTIDSFDAGSNILSAETRFTIQDVAGSLSTDSGCHD